MLAILSVATEMYVNDAIVVEPVEQMLTCCGNIDQFLAADFSCIAAEATLRAGDPHRLAGQPIVMLVGNVMSLMAFGHETVRERIVAGSFRQLGSELQMSRDPIGGATGRRFHTGG